MGYENLKVHNREPRYISATNAVDGVLADKLIALVDKRGSASDWDANPHTLEYQMANPFSKNERNVDAEDLEVLPELFQLAHSFLRQFNRSLNNTVCETVTGCHGFWIMKYTEGAEFLPHMDWGSNPEAITPPVVASLSIKLNEGFVGGELLHLEGKDKYKIDVPLYGCVGHDGFTMHEVSKIEKGVRYSLVIHYTGSIA